MANGREILRRADHADGDASAGQPRIMSSVRGAVVDGVRHAVVQHQHRLARIGRHHARPGCAPAAAGRPAPRRLRSCSVTAGWVRFSRSAASVTLPGRCDRGDGAKLAQREIMQITLAHRLTLWRPRKSKFHLSHGDRQHRTSQSKAQAATREPRQERSMSPAGSEPIRSPCPNHPARWIRRTGRARRLARLVSRLAVRHCAEIVRARRSRTASRAPWATAGSNSDGDVQKALDVAPHEIAMRALAEAGAGGGASEECEHDRISRSGSASRHCHRPAGRLVQYRHQHAHRHDLLHVPKGRPGDEPAGPFRGSGTRQLAAGFAVYGPQTTLVLTLATGSSSSRSTGSDELPARRARDITHSARARANTPSTPPTTATGNSRCAPMSTIA